MDGKDGDKGASEPGGVGSGRGNHREATWAEMILRYAGALGMVIGLLITLLLYAILSPLLFLPLLLAEVIRGRRWLRKRSAG